MGAGRMGRRGFLAQITKTSEEEVKFTGFKNATMLS
jgi:hypothetical protein